MKTMNKILFLLICLALAMPNIFALSCVTMSTGGTKEIDTQNKITNYVSLRIYNSTTGEGICEDGTYTLKAELVKNSTSDPFNKNSILTFFDYSFSDNNFQLTNGENQRSLLTLTPKQSGVYIIKITATKSPSTTGGASIVSTTSALIKVEVQGTDSVVQPVAQEVPFWTTHKSCSDGTVILNTQNCPSDLNKVSVSQQTNKQAVDQNVLQSNALIDTTNIPIQAILGILIIGGTCVLLFKPKKEKLVKQEPEPIVQEIQKEIILKNDPLPIVQETITPKTIIQSKLMIQPNKIVKRIVKRKVIVEKEIPKKTILPKKVSPKPIKEIKRNFPTQSKKLETKVLNLEPEKIEVIKEPQSFPNPLLQLMDDRQIKKEEQPKEDGN